MTGVDVHLWWADLTAADVALEAGLPGPERARLEGLTGADRARRAVGAALLQQAVRAHRRQSVPTRDFSPRDDAPQDDAGEQEVVVDRTCEECGAQHGRPVVAGGPHVSVAHCGVLVVVATCTDTRVGVDVERVDRFEGAVAAAQAWVRHEALIKAGGPGATLLLPAPLPGYVAALCVAGVEEAQVRLEEHR